MTRPFILRKGVSLLSDLADGMAAYMPLMGGTLFHVDGAHAEANDNNDGTDPAKPLSTITGAYARCTDGLNDVIWVKGARRYRENQLTIEKDGLRIIGSGWGTEWNHSSGQTGDYVCKVQAKGVVIANMQISVNDVGSGVYWGDGGSAVDANASVGLLENCFLRGDWFTGSGPGAGIVNGVRVDGAALLTVRNCHIWSWATGIYLADGAARTNYGAHLYGNYITGKTYGIYSAGAGNFGYTSVIEGNTIWDWAPGVAMTYGISLNHAVGAYIVANNHIGCTTGVYDLGDVNIWVANDIHKTFAASEAVARNEEAWSGH